MKKTLVLSAALSASLSLTATAATIQVADFESGTLEGWDLYATVAPNLPPAAADPLANVNAGGVGNSKYVFTEDRADGTVFFRAPTTWAGDYFGGSLSFYLKNLNPTNPFATTNTQGILFIESSGGPNLFYRATMPTTSYPPGDGWTLYNIALDTAGAWSLNEFSLNPANATQIQNALSTITRIHIIADTASGYFGKPSAAAAFGHDQTGLDNVTLNPANNPVPEPGTLLLTLTGLAGAALLRRRAA